MWDVRTCEKSRIEGLQSIDWGLPEVAADMAKRREADKKYNEQKRAQNALVAKAVVPEFEHALRALEQRVMAECIHANDRGSERNEPSF